MVTTQSKKYSVIDVSAVVSIFSVHNNQLEVLLSVRDSEPLKGYWFIPANRINIDESLEDAARRVLEEITGLHYPYLEQLHTFGRPNRFPNERRIAVAYYALVPPDTVISSHRKNRPPCSWYSVNNLPQLAFDHNEILQYGVTRIKSKLNHSAIASSLLPKSFRLSDLQSIYESIYEKHLDKRNFRKKVLHSGLLQPTGEILSGGRHRPARLYSFTKETQISLV